MNDFKRTHTKHGEGLECPRCGGKIIVAWRRLIAAKRKAGVRCSMCPYCSKASGLPGVKARAGVPDDEYIGR